MKTRFANSTHVLVAALVVLALAICVGCSSEEKEEAQTTPGAQTTAGRTIDKAKDLKVSVANPEPDVDPVCGMKVDYQTIATVDGKNYAFCSESCVEKFKEDPEKYLAAAKK